MTWQTAAVLIWAAALAISAGLSIITWRSTTGGQIIDTPDGLGGRRSYSRLQLALMPPFMIGVAGLVIYFGLDFEIPEGGAVYAGLWIVGLLVVQVVLIGIVRARRRDRQKKRTELFGE